MIALSKALNMNKTITNLSLTYCNIDAKGARAIFEILIYQGSNLSDLNLGGNHLRNDGVIQVLKGVGAAKNLTKIWLSDNQFMEEDHVLEAIEACMKMNQNLGKYDFRHNFIGDYGVK